MLEQLHPLGGITHRRMFGGVGLSLRDLVQLYTGLANDALKVLDSALAKGDFLVGGEATVADVAVYGDVAYADEGGIDRRFVGCCRRCHSSSPI